MSKPRRRYAREFKIEAVKLITEGGHSNQPTNLQQGCKFLNWSNTALLTR